MSVVSTDACHRLLAYTDSEINYAHGFKHQHADRTEPI